MAIGHYVYRRNASMGVPDGSSAGSFVEGRSDPPAGARGRRTAVCSVDGEANPQCQIGHSRWLCGLASPRRGLITRCPPALPAGVPSPMSNRERHALVLGVCRSFNS